MTSVKPPTPNVLLQQARKAREWTKTQLIYFLGQAAGEENATLAAKANLPRYIARWENEGIQPDEVHARLLCRVYGKTPAELGLTDPDAALEPEPVPGAEYPQTTDEALSTVADLWRVDLASASPLHTAPAEAHAGELASLRWLLSSGAAPVPEYPDGIRVGLRDVHAIKTTTDMFATLDDSYGGGHARTALIQYLNTDVARMLTGRYTEAVGRALFGTVAEATMLAAWMSYDTGHHGTAQRYFVQALRLAQDGENRRLAGSILSAMSHQATYLGNFREATTLAQAAQMGITGVATPTLTAQFQAMEARGLAGAGDRSGAEAALAKSARSLEAQRLEVEPEWITYFDAAELAAEAGHCFRDLEQSAHAVTHASTAASGHVRSDFFSTMVLAEGHLGAGDLDEACRVALDALDIGEQLKSARVVSYLRDFRRHLASHADAAPVRDFTEEATDFRLWTRSG